MEHVILPQGLSWVPVGSQPLGYSALLLEYGLDCPPPRRLTAIGHTSYRSTLSIEGIQWLLLPKTSGIRVPNHRIEHLGVALKHESLDLRILGRLFEAGIEAELTSFISANRSGLYTRRAWFFYEWLTGRKLDIEEPYGVQYVSALDTSEYFTLRRSARSVRHKVENNMPGVPGFCPIVRRTERLAGDVLDNLAGEARQVLSDADPAVLRRAVGFMLLEESKGSFGIEGEAPPRTRLERWGKLIAQAKDIELSVEALERLHRSLFDDARSFTRLGLREGGGFVGRHDARDQSPIPDHISARPGDLRGLMDALLTTYRLLRADGFDPIVTAAVLGFGFVFIHPFEDGNGRLHRFLFQKCLADFGFNPEGVILPVSAAILEDLAGYRVALEEFSTMALRSIEWKGTLDGNVAVLNDTAYLYRHFDATKQAEYLADRIQRTIRFSLPSELDFLHRFDDAKRRIADLIDLPDRLASIFIRFCIQNGGVLSVRKRSEFFPELPDNVVQELEEATRASGIVPDRKR